MYIDLTHVIENDMPCHPYDDGLKLLRNKFLSKDKFNDSILETGMHVGTHVDAPSHLTNSNKLISDYPVEKFAGRGKLLDVRGEKKITLKKKYIDTVNSDDIVLLHTGFDKEFRKEEYFLEHPVLTDELIDFFVETKVKLIGVDLPSPDIAPFNAHKKLLQNDILIIENLTNLSKLVEVADFEIIAFPLKIQAEGSPVRVVAKV
uniref:cyclase family protein n=1 Tax=Proteinivorax hydrogeniformans TaxID=1826727 RepID=UPI003EBA121D